jgi:hypothetical protein
MFLKIVHFLYIEISFEISKLMSSSFSEQVKKGVSVELL